MKAKQRTPSGPVRANVLVVEDEQDVRDLVRHNLECEGFAVKAVGSGEEAVRAARSAIPDVVVLDLMLPGIDGLEVCRILKADRDTERVQVIMLTAKGEEADIVVGLELGADDYMVKPFSPRVLIARIKAVLRRVSEPSLLDAAEVVRVGRLVVDPLRHEVRIDDHPVEVTNTEFSIVQYLGRRPGRVRTRTQIIEAVQDGPVAVTDRSVDVHITSLRRKLGAAGRYVKTVRGVGYRLEEC